MKLFKFKKSDNIDPFSKVKAKKDWKKKILKISVISFGIIVLGSILVGGGIYYYVGRDLPSIVSLSDRKLIESSQIYDSTGEVLLYEIAGTENRKIIKSDEIPDTVKKAFISIEDREFYTHLGVRPMAIIRAAYQNFTGNGVGGGGSTITQQFVKNAILTNEKTFSRKIKEAVLALQVEQNYSKEEIITFYLNEIPFGGQVYGIESASQYFFGKQTKDLEAYQAAMLAAMIQRPTYYSPFGSNFDKLYERQQYVLRVMRDEGYLSEDEYQEQKSKELKVASSIVNIKAPHFVFYVREKLAEQFGEETLEQGGLKIITTLDWNMQQLAEKTVKETLDGLKSKYDAQNAAMGVIDPDNGQILAMVGSRDYYDESVDGNVNVLVTPQSPGSSIKPLVYATAFDKGFNPNTILFDLPTNFETVDGKPKYEPNNFNLQFNGPVSMRRSLATSLNVPAVKTLYLAGIKNFQRKSFDLGITDYPESKEMGLATALGGSDLKLIEHFGSYSVFPNDGKINPIASVKEVINSKNDVLYSWKSREKQVFSEQTARQVVDVMSDNEARSPVFGFTNDLSVPGVDTGAKTGTSQEFRDALTVGYTNNLVVGVWVGKNDNSPMKNGADGSVVAAPIWNRFIREVVKVRTPGKFIEPEPVNVNKPMLNGIVGGSKTAKVNRVTGKLASDNTPPELIDEKEYKSVHNILYYVDPEDPLNTSWPKNPFKDKMFNQWEAPVKEWARNNAEYSSEPPTETDDVYVEQNRPTIVISSPSTAVKLPETTISGTATAPNGIRQVEVYLNDTLVGSFQNGDFSKKIPLTKEGENIILVKAWDNNYYKNELTQVFTADIDVVPPVIGSFKVTGSSITGFNLIANITDAKTSVKTVDFYEDTLGKITTLTLPSSDKSTYTSTYIPTLDPTKTTYTFYVKATDEWSNVVTSNKVVAP